MDGPEDRRKETSIAPASVGSTRTFERPGVAWVVLGLCLLITYISWQVSLSQMEHRNLERFQTHVLQVTEAIQTRIEAYEQVLKGANGLFAASERVKREEWHEYVRSLNVNQRYPGIRVLGYIAQVRRGDVAEFVAANRREGMADYAVRSWDKFTGEREVHFLIQYVEPLKGNVRALGFDISTEPLHREAAELSRDSGEAAMTARIRLVQSDDDEPAVLLLLPVYHPGVVTTNTAQRREALVGWVYGGFIIRDLMVGLFESSDSAIDFEIFDGARPSRSSLLYDADGVLHALNGHDATFQTFVSPIPVAGRQWSMYFSTRPAFDAATNYTETNLLVITGLAISFLLFGITRSLASNRLKAIAIAQQMTEKFHLRERAVVSSSNGIFITDAASVGNPILYANPALGRITGYTADELNGRRITSFLRDDQGGHELARLESAIAAGEECRVVLRGERQDGLLFWAEISVSPVRDEAGIVNHFVGVVADITDRKNTEEKLREATVAATAASRAKGEFLANMSHEIRTPMNAVIGMTELALGTEMTREQRSYLSSVRNSARDLLTIIEDVLDFSRIEAGKFDLLPEAFRLRDAFGQAVKSFGVKAAAKRLELTFRCAQDVPDSLVGDVRRLRQVLINLVGNAIKFTDAGEVAVDVRASNVSSGPGRRELQVSVTDTGIGVPRDKQQSVFEAFTQADASVTRQFGGTGLGLAISSNLCRLMEGRIWVESDGEHGSRFCFAVPLNVDTRPATRIDFPPIGRIAGQRVLVVDNHLGSRQVLSELLSAWGMLPFLAASASEALVELKSREAGFFSVAFVDAEMPRRDGFSLLQELGEITGGALPVVMMLSSSGNSDQIRRCREMGHDAYVTKPILQAELIEALVECFGGRSRPPKAATSDTTLLAKGQLTVLLAEDNSVNRELASTVLARMGHAVVNVWNGLEAVDAWRAGSVDAILMDIQMPLMDGMEATTMIRREESGTGRHVPIIGLTAHAMKGNREHALALGMDAYLTKPLQADALEKIFRSLNAPVGGSGTAGRGAFDPSALLRSLGGDVAALTRLLELYLETTPPLMDRLRRCVQQGDGPTAAYVAHTLKGSLTQMGDITARTLASEIEVLARENRLRETQSIVEDLAKRLEGLESSVRSWRAKQH